jgi:hypothetical protein
MPRLTKIDARDLFDGRLEKFVENDPTLLLPENKDKLLNGARSIYDRDHAVTVTLSPEDIVLAKMIATHEEFYANGCLLSLQ